MPRLSTVLPFALVTLSAGAVLAQADQAGQVTPEPAPVERHAPTPDQYAAQHHLQHEARANAEPRFYSATLAAGGVLSTTVGTASAEPVTGVYLRVAPNSSVREVATDAQHTEFRVERGLANISVRNPSDGMLLLVDLPNGQVQMLKNGFYTFNATNNTVRVLKGEANAFPNSGAGSAADTKPLKVKEDHAVTFAAASQASAKLRSVEFYPFQASNDVIPQPYDYARATDRPHYGYAPYGGGYAPYGGFYGGPYPYSAWGGPYWGEPYFGYPYGFGFGFGYGFYGGGFGGFRGRR